ncbi:PP2C family protein-serine/threonine phosphatase [Streptantibioticus cattleyicolor]|uniref:Response regulator receiver protein n=1 Tax=Streptantibioticus cattleyicolor (strain ATCC 35852 / DSM 46488 / JCM 4925 / NBRC 14057 / NRRL 8057) TaxID=1003195 RepID=F8JJS5_STREN|nr:fused response regulator/phosphatase [Streptantibioticus cattleyicolor]AEW98648.1 response regulator receiver protein [Streptantibioticus cattleyicolor NRRL 8057 = DSM 46488]CCB72292.1 Response regulator receiver protein [Streptantibioticus cattleyicolor NRRL 8057 = DSM 46488]
MMPEPVLPGEFSSVGASSRGDRVTGGGGPVPAPRGGAVEHATSDDLAPGRTEPRVLLIEDDAADALLVEELVADVTPGMGMRLTWVRSVAQARAELARTVPDCVLLDLHLPDASGLEALAAVQECAEGVAVVVLTGLAEERTGLAAVAAGAQDYLVKGRVEPELFGRAVRYAIQRKQTEKAAAELQAGKLRAQENARLERGLLPTPLLNGDDSVEVVARYRPGRSQALLGGDFHDVVQQPDGTVHALVGDVSGHGPDEAALGVALRIAWRTLVLSGAPTQRQLRLLEEILVAERAGAEIFATLTSAVLPPDRRRVRLVRAGHHGVLWREADGVRWVEVPGGPALGIVPGRAHWPVQELELPHGAGLVVFTDGLFEGRSGPDGQRLGEEGLLRLAGTLTGLPAEPFVDRLIARAEELAEEYGGLADDVAVLHLRWSDRRKEETGA